MLKALAQRPSRPRSEVVKLAVSAALQESLPGRACIDACHATTRERDATCGSPGTEPSEEHRWPRAKGAYAQQGGTEDLGPTAERRGNFAQAFTNLGLITATLSLDRQLG
jgi:hypothetical protein